MYEVGIIFWHTSDCWELTIIIEWGIRQNGNLTYHLFLQLFILYIYKGNQLPDIQYIGSEGMKQSLN